MADVRDNPDARRYDVFTDDGQLAGFAQYVKRAGRVIFTHTEIDDAFEGKGLGSRLARAVLDDARAHELRVVPLCPFIAAYLERHPEYQDLVDQDALTALS
jgi:predicted GNAT family acetyltransferase